MADGSSFPGSPVQENQSDQESDRSLVFFLTVRTIDGPLGASNSALPMQHEITARAEKEEWN